MSNYTIRGRKLLNEGNDGLFYAEYVVGDGELHHVGCFLSVEIPKVLGNFHGGRCSLQNFVHMVLMLII